MYFLSEEERRYLLKGLIPRARRNEVSSELRGWNWHEPPLEPLYDVRLGVWEVAGRYCESGRDLFLRRVRDCTFKPNAAMTAGSAYHSILAELLVSVKRTIYQVGVAECVGALSRLREPRPAQIAGVVERIPPEYRESVGRKCSSLWRFEADRVLARVQDALAMCPHIREDSLVNQVVPVIVEHRLDGSFLGLSKNLSTDALLVSGPMVVDIKFGEPRDFHRLSTTGYALAMEALYEHPVDAGCLVYVRFNGDGLRVERDLHLIDDELRQWFVEERDSKMRMVFEEVDPGRADSCRPEECPVGEGCTTE